VLVGLVLAGLVWSGIAPVSRLTWLMEVVWVVVGLPLVLVSSVCLACSASFEFIEWWSALALGSAADAYLATQGDVWDTQWDMFLCLIGALVAQLLLSRTHDRQLATIHRGQPQVETSPATQSHADLEAPR
jgi:uncharacterized membrane protein YjdF